MDTTETPGGFITGLVLPPTWPAGIVEPFWSKESQSPAWYSNAGSVAPSMITSPMTSMVPDMQIAPTGNFIRGGLERSTMRPYRMERQTACAVRATCDPVTAIRPYPTSLMLVKYVTPERARTLTIKRPYDCMVEHHVEVLSLVLLSPHSKLVRERVTQAPVDSAGVRVF